MKDPRREWLRLLPLRPHDSHKGNNGHVLIVAGSDAMTGAAVLAARGALRAGAGLVTVASSPEGRDAIRHHLVEAMTVALAELASYIKKRKISALAMGPGLGATPATQKMVRSLLRHALPTVLDADALNVLKLADLPKRSDLVVTPHEGELARLLPRSRESIHAARRLAATTTATAFGGVCVLKGAATLVASPSEVYTNTTGNPAMAAGGMGDVLTGVIAAFCAQGMPVYEAACLGVYLHGAAGDLAAKTDRGLLAHEVADALPQALQRLRVAV